MIVSKVYKRCVVEKHVGRFRQHNTEWVPEGLAVVGNVLSQRIQQEIWDNGWLVMEVLDETTDSEALGFQREWKQLPRS
jgi:hypothetical protein